MNATFISFKKVMKTDVVPGRELVIDQQVGDDVLEIPRLVDTAHDQQKGKTDGVPRQTSAIRIRLATIGVICDHMFTV